MGGEVIMDNKTGRNSMDVVMELVHLHFRETRSPSRPFTEEDIEKVYLKYYDLVKENR